MSGEVDLLSRSFSTLFLKWSTILNPFSAGNCNGSIDSAPFLLLPLERADSFVFPRGNRAELAGRTEGRAESAEVRVRALSERVASCMGLEWTSRLPW